MTPRAVGSVSHPGASLMIRWTVAAAVGAVAAAAHAHHSIAAAYDTSRQITVEGRVTEFLFVNPHPVLVLDVTKSGGATEIWRLELDNRSELVAIGVDASTFKPGEQVIATGSAGRNHALALYAMRVERPADGLLYEQIGYSPRIGHGARRR
jgi:hypothetical protein